MIPKSIDVSRVEWSDQEGWDRPGQSASLLVIGAACLAWWAASLIVGPVWLAMRRHEPDVTDETWPAGVRP